jgi:hypothetical protein
MKAGYWEDAEAGDGASNAESIISFQEVESNVSTGSSVGQSGELGRDGLWYICGPTS